MISPLSVAPKEARMVHPVADLPSPNEQEVLRVQEYQRRMKMLAWQWREMLFIERLVLSLKLYGKGPRAPWYNRLFASILCSRAHFLLSNNFLLITLRGRKSGRLISTPVNYVNARGGNFYIISKRERRWWRNLCDGAQVTLRLRGQERSGVGSVCVDELAVQNDLLHLIQRVPKTAKKFHIGWTENGEPNFADVARFAKQHVIVRVHL